MQHKVFCSFGSILACGKVSVNSDVPTAATNGWDVIYNPTFIEEHMKTDPELRFLVLHEAMHKAYRHLQVWTALHDEDAQLANIAADHFVNLSLVDMDADEGFIKMPELGVQPDAKYRGWSVKQIFEDLKQEQEEGGGGGGDDGDEGGNGFDEHDWKGAKELTDKEKSELERDVDAGIRQGLIAQQKIAGKGAGGMNRELGDLLEPQIDWREVMREFVKSICSSKDASSWRRVNRRFLSSGVYMPTLIGESIGSLVIGIDTSGSIGTKELNTFLSEVQAIAKDVNPQKVDLIYWDSEVASHEEYDTCTLPNIVSSTKPRGGGGTDPTALQDYLIKNNIVPECIVMLTDGCINDWGTEWNAPVLWTICGNSRVYAPVGKTVHVND
jgi:predicted metal-dependent peptidase